MPEPWRAVPSRACLVLAALGIVGVVGAWFQASSDTTVGAQVLWTNVSICGAITCGVASGMHLIGRTRATSARRAAVLAILAEVLERPASPQEGDQALLVTTPSMRLYHRADCPLAVRKPVEAVQLPQLLADGRRPCGVCRP